MEPAAFWSVTMKRADGVLIPAIEELTSDELRAQPMGHDTSPIGWLAWHLSKVQDDYIALISNGETVWEGQGWNSRFPNAEGALHIAPEKVGTFDPVDAQVLLAYYQAVRERATDVMAGLTPDDFERVCESTTPGGRSMAVSEILAMVTSDTLQHIGQIAYLRGILRDQGWYAKRRALA
ncbi:MAG: DinB family protein [Chloroflexi bacterium]|nr:DinB family protein [Chloroflexota bacterium]